MAKIKHIAISTQDPDETAQFYVDVFGLQRVGKIESDTAEGYYLSDGNVNLAVVKYTSETVAGELGIGYNGIHHIGFEVDDVADSDARLKRASSFPINGANESLKENVRNGHARRNVELKYEGPDGVMINISQNGWVGTGKR